MNFPFYLIWMLVSAFALGGCSTSPGKSLPNRVSLKHPCQVMSPAKAGEYYQLTYDGLEITVDGAPPPVCRLPQGALFSIDLLRVDPSGGLTRVYARGSVNCHGKEYPVEMYLRIAENSGILQAVYDEISKDNNRFWTVYKP